MLVRSTIQGSFVKCSYLKRLLSHILSDVMPSTDVINCPQDVWKKRYLCLAHVEFFFVWFEVDAPFPPTNVIECYRKKLQKLLSDPENEEFQELFRTRNRFVDPVYWIRRNHFLSR